MLFTSLWKHKLHTIFVIFVFMKKSPKGCENQLVLKVSKMDAMVGIMESQSLLTALDQRTMHLYFKRNVQFADILY